MPKLSVVILNWNGSHYTIPCIKSLLNSSFQDFEIVLVDNGSERKDIKAIENEFEGNEKIKIIKNSENKGFAEGNNIGVRNSSPESKYVLLLNNDAVVKKDYLKEMVEAIESNSSIGAVGIGYRPNSKDVLLHTLSLVGFDVVYYNEKFVNEGIYPKLYISGARFMFNKSLIKEPFDPEYFIYCEDVYLGWLIWLKGYKVIAKHTKNPEARMIHYGEHVLQKKKSSFSVFLGTRNRLLNIFLFYELRTLIKLLPLIFIAYFIYLISEPKFILTRMKAYLWFPTNFKKILEKRKKIQMQRKVPDEEIIKVMSCKFKSYYDVKNPFFRGVITLINKVFYVYCKMVNLKTIDMIIF
ncbi:MAG: glycosyltransferase family 2 protein [Candidatus Altiarchaeota archaeon]